MASLSSCRSMYILCRFCCEYEQSPGMLKLFQRSVAPSLSDRKALVGRREVARLTRFETEAVMVMVSDSDSGVD